MLRCTNELFNKSNRAQLGAQLDAKLGAQLGAQLEIKMLLFHDFSGNVDLSFLFVCLP